MGFDDFTRLIRGFRENWRWLYCLIFCLVLAALGSYLIGHQDGRPEESLDRSIPSTYINGCHLPLDGYKPLPCFGNQTPNLSTVYLVGDSHAAQWIPGIEAANNSDLLNFRFLTKSSCPFVPLGLNSNCEKWIDNVVNEINTFKPEVIIISGLTNGQYLNFYTERAYANFWISRFESLLKKIPPQSQVVLIEDTPYSAFDTSECLLSNKEDGCKFHLRLSELTLELRKFAFESSFTYISYNEQLCPGFQCLAGDSYTNYFRDRHHISVSASKKLGSSLLEQINKTISQKQ